MKHTTRTFQESPAVKPIQESQNKEKSDSDNGSNEENDPDECVTEETGPTPACSSPGLPGCLGLLLLIFSLRV